MAVRVVVWEGSSGDGVCGWFDDGDGVGSRMVVSGVVVLGV